MDAQLAFARALLVPKIVGPNTSAMANKWQSRQLPWQTVRGTLTRHPLAREAVTVGPMPP